MRRVFFALCSRRGVDKIYQIYDLVTDLILLRPRYNHWSIAITFLASWSSKMEPKSMVACSFSSALISQTSKQNPISNSYFKHLKLNIYWWTFVGANCIIHIPEMDHKFAIDYLSKLLHQSTIYVLLSPLFTQMPSVHFSLKFNLSQIGSFSKNITRSFYYFWKLVRREFKVCIFRDIRADHGKWFGHYSRSK